MALIPVVAIAAIYAGLHVPLPGEAREPLVNDAQAVDPGDIDVAIALDYDAIQLVSQDAKADKTAKALTPDDRAKEAAQRFLTLSADEQHRLRARFAEIRDLPAPRRAELMSKYEAFERLSAEERESLRAASRNSSRQW